VSANSHDSRDTIWPEIARWYRCLPAELQEMFVVGKERVTVSAIQRAPSLWLVGLQGQP
jgi:hypothetical protein